jgi:hypothetical protein
VSTDDGTYKTSFKGFGNEENSAEENENVEESENVQENENVEENESTLANESERLIASKVEWFSDVSYKGGIMLSGEPLLLSSLGLMREEETIISGDFSFAAAFQNKVFLSLGNSVSVFEIDQTSFIATLIKEMQFPSTVLGLSSGSSGVFAITSSSSFCSIYKMNENLYAKMTDLPALSGIDVKGDEVFCISENKIIVFDDVGDNLKRKQVFDYVGGKYLCFFDNQLIVANVKNNLDVFDAEREEFLPLIAARSDAEYFFDSPAGVYSRNNKIFVADTFNDRIAVISGSDIEYMSGYPTDNGIAPFVQPVSVATTSNAVFVAHNINELTNCESGETIEITHEGKTLSIIKILADSRDNVFVLAKHSMSATFYAYKISGNVLPSPLPLTSPTAMGGGRNGDIYFLDEGKIKSESTDIMSLGETVLIDFCVDLSGKIFGIDSNESFLIIDKDSIERYSIQAEKLAFSSLSSEENSFGDILLLSSKNHTLSIIDADDAGVADINDYFPPVNINEKTALEKTEGRIAKTISSVPLYYQPIEINSVFTLEKDSFVFIQFEASAPDNMYFIVTQGNEGDALRCGYIAKNTVEVLDYSVPESKTAKVIYDNAQYQNIYKYPSLASPTIGDLNLGDWVRPLDFVSDSSFFDWLRIDMGENEGYVLRQGVSWTLYSTKREEPNTNAVIISDATLYIKNYATGEYEVLDESFIPKNTRVQIETPFDSARKYSKVVFLREGENGKEVIDIECYVLTKCVKYDGVDILKIVIICVAVISVLLFSVLVFHLIKRKRLRRYVD